MKLKEGKITCDQGSASALKSCHLLPLEQLFFFYQWRRHIPQTLKKERENLGNILPPQ